MVFSQYYVGNVCRLIWECTRNFSLFQGLGWFTTLIPFLLHKSALHYYIESISAPLENGEFFHSDIAFS